MTPDPCSHMGVGYFFKTEEKVIRRHCQEEGILHPAAFSDLKNHRIY